MVVGRTPLVLAALAALGLVGGTGGPILIAAGSEVISVLLTGAALLLGAAAMRRAVQAKD